MNIMSISHVRIMDMLQLLWSNPYKPFGETYVDLLVAM